MQNELEAITAVIREVPDFPQEGILFKDITPLLGDGELFRSCISLLVERIRGLNVTKVVGLDARGFIFGGAVADRLGIGFIPLRKGGKLPYQTESVSYDLEYGSQVMEVHVDAVSEGERVVIVDDLLATGGTASAAAELITQIGGVVVAFQFVIELDFLAGRKRLGATEVEALIHY